MGGGRAPLLFLSLRSAGACWMPDLKSHHLQRADMKLADNCRANRRAGITLPATMGHRDGRDQCMVWITLAIQVLKHPRMMDILAYLTLMSTRT